MRGSIKFCQRGSNFVGGGGGGGGVFCLVILAKLRQIKDILKMHFQILIPPKFKRIWKFYFWNVCCDIPFRFFHKRLEKTNVIYM